jgi:hypothetical protein
VGNSRGARKLARTPHVNQKKKKKKKAYAYKTSKIMWPHIIIVSILESKCTNMKGKGVEEKKIMKRKK